MSFYPDMIRPAAGGQTRAFTLVVNEFGEVVMCSLDKDGKPTGFTTCETGRELLNLLARVFMNDKGCFRINMIEDDHNACWHMLGVDTWAEAAAILNGKSCAKRTRVDRRREEWSSYTRSYHPKVERYLVRDGDSRDYKVTDLGKKLDAMRE